MHEVLTVSKDIMLQILLLMDANGALCLLDLNIGNYLLPRFL